MVSYNLRQIIIFMNSKNGNNVQALNAISTIFKKTLAFTFRMILLVPDYQQQQTTRIRHYDNQCEAAHLISEVLKTALNKRRMEAFIALKNNQHRNKKAVYAYRSKTFYQKKDLQESDNRRRTVIWSRPKKRTSFQSPTKKTELSEIFSRVKIMTAELLTPTYGSKRMGSNEGSNRKLKNEIFYKIEQLQINLNRLANEKKNKYITPELSTNYTIRKRIQNQRQKQKFRNVNISQFDIYF